jgi:Spy/CpxP family protein refolding chaperone
MASMLLASVKSIALKPEQKTAADGIAADIEKLGDQHGESGKKLADDVADGVAAGKIDHAKTGADIRAIAKAVEATGVGVQDAVNRLHQMLDPEQRKKLAETMREKGKEMREHMAGEGDHEHGMGPGAPEAHGKGPGGPGGPEMHGPGGHEMHGGGHEGEHGMAGHMEKLADELGLLPEQREKIRTKLEGQMKAKEATMKAKMAASEKHMEAIGTAFQAEKFDAKKAGVGVQAPDMAKTMATERVTFVETVLAVLTPDQRAKFAAHLREHAGDMD